MFISLAAPITIIFSLPILSVWVVRTHYQISYHVYFQPLKTKACLDNNILSDGIFCVKGVNQVTVTSKRLDKCLELHPPIFLVNNEYECMQQQSLNTMIYKDSLKGGP